MVGTHIDLLGYTVSIQSEINYQLSYLLVFSRITWCCVRRTFVKISECSSFFNSFILLYSIISFHSSFDAFKSKFFKTKKIQTINFLGEGMG